jgi:uncharacterized Zn finger protein
MSASDTATATLGDRWMRSAAGDSARARQRLEKGRAGAGRLVDVMQVAPGTISVRVPDGRGRSHDVSVQVPVLTDEQWDEVVARTGRAVRHTAALLAGRLPSVLLEDDLLFPGPMQAHCTCSEQRPCRHEAATHHAIATAIDRDPPRLLRIRGRSVDDLLDALRSARGTRHDHEDTTSVDLSEPLTARGDLEGIDVHPVPTPDVSTIFERLGPPPGFEDPEVIERLMSEAAALAWRLAAGEGSEAADDEALLAELRAQGVATAGSIASSLGLDAGVAQEVLDRLYSAGTVLRMGEGETARYRAA